jgi:hypothetical protein
VVVELRFLEKQRVTEAGAPYSPWSDTVSFNLPDTWLSKVPSELEPTLVKAPSEPEGAVAAEPLEPSLSDTSQTLEAPAFQPELAEPSEAQAVGETSEMQVYSRVAPLPPVVADSRPTICLRALAALRASEKAGDSGLQRGLAEIERRHRGRFGELGGLAAESDAGLVFLFERPVRALQFALFCLQQAREENTELELRAGVHLGEILLAERAGDPRAAFQASGPATRNCHRLAELADEDHALLTPETAALVRGALLESQGEIFLSTQSPQYFDELGEMLALVEASTARFGLRRDLAATHA